MSDHDLIRRGDAIALFDAPNIIEDLRALPAVSPGVKALEWRTAKISDKRERWIANTIFGQYEILEYSNGSFGWNICFYDEDLEALQYAAKNIEAAKAAAQADYEARIRSALTITTHDPAKVAALEKAVEVLEQCEIMLRLRGHNEVAAIARATLAEIKAT